MRGSPHANRVSSFAGPMPLAICYAYICRSVCRVERCVVQDTLARVRGTINQTRSSGGIVNKQSNPILSCRPKEIMNLEVRI